MIDWLRAAKSANFYRKRKRLPKRAIIELFGGIREKSGTASRNIFFHVKETLGHSTWSAIAFFYEREPAFLQFPPNVRHTRERVCGFLFVVEHREYAVVFKSNLDLPSNFKTEYLQRVGDQNFESAIARVGATFEQIRLSSMTTSKHALRSKTLEADNLQNLIGLAGASRYIAKSYRVRQQNGHITGTPSTGRLSLRADKSPYRDLVAWAQNSIALLEDRTPTLSPFITAFARPIDLASMPEDLLPTYVTFNVPQLVEDIFETPEIRLVRRIANDGELLNKDAIDAILAALEQNFAVREIRGEMQIVDPDDDASVGNISINKSRISLRKLDIPEIEDVYVEPANSPLDQREEGIALKRHLDHNNLFSVLFNDLAVVYVDGILYRDSNLTDGRMFLSHIQICRQLNDVTTEKGAFIVEQTTFDRNSIFGVIVNHIADNGELLACDDLGIEWADFVGINGTSKPKTFSFYHAKYGPITLGASSLHAAVSQAMKNLGHLNSSTDEIDAKITKWEEHYAGNNVETQIKRIVGGNTNLFRTQLDETRLSPDTFRRIFIVTSALSRGQLEAKFREIQEGMAPSGSFVQLYWLLMSFFSACTEVNANGYVLCQE